MRVAINGFGRIGRGVLRALYESDFRKNLEIVAINEPADFASVVHLIKYDSVHGRFSGKISVDESLDELSSSEQCLKLQFGQYVDTIKVFHEENIQNLNWKSLNIDLLLECSGSVSADSINQVLNELPALRVLFSRPMLETEVDNTIVYGVNHDSLTADHRLISAASCTTNAIVPVLDTIDKAFGVDYVTSTTMHSLMNDQPVLDAYHNTNLRKTRAASHSMIPVNTELAKGIERILPHLRGRLSSQAVRVPTLNVSAIDLSVMLKNDSDIEKINESLMTATLKSSLNILDVSTEALASCDFNHRQESAIIDASQTRMSGSRLLKVWIWFDNEWAYAHRMLDIASIIKFFNKH